MRVVSSVLLLLSLLLLLLLMLLLMLWLLMLLLCLVCVLWLGGQLIQKNPVLSVYMGLRTVSNFHMTVFFNGVTGVVVLLCPD